MKRRVEEHDQHLGLKYLLYVIHSEPTPGAALETFQCCSSSVRLGKDRAKYLGLTCPGELGSVAAPAGGHDEDIELTHA